MKNFLAFIFGGLFSIGLILSGMSNPEKVLNFLDLFGDWDASLAFVMIGAIMVAIIPFQKAVRSKAPKTVFNEPIELPGNHKIDPKLMSGSLLFGIGWGIAGICPAPSFTLIGLGHYQVLYFIVAMLAGVLLHRKWTGA
ncbi:YeeE/YedE family protein [Acinetobacter gerneri]|uniref:YeeE/YedE family protein n=1 Tax=Acinetobacter gerneri TaxID=202952 RepID=UPI0028A6F8D9|nr:YeeE/YedE family protein [Acinetobacter gerneri]